MQCSVVSVMDATHPNPHASAYVAASVCAHRGWPLSASPSSLSGPSPSSLQDLLQLGSALGGIDSMNSPDFDFDAMTVPAERRGKRDRGWSPEPMDDVEGMGSPKRKRR